MTNRFQSMNAYLVVQDGPACYDDRCHGRDMDSGAAVIKHHMETSSLSTFGEDVQSFSI